jgi:XTP/dITP diphosphohydrolase
MKKLIIASTNHGKIKEILSVIESFNISDLEIGSLLDYHITEPDEPYDTFEENAAHKAEYYGKILNEMTLCDDSGLCVDALSGFPGVKTKDFAVECGGLQAAFLALELLLQDHQNKQASFHSSLALYVPEGEQVIIRSAAEKGTLTFPARGETGFGFGFDPVFIPVGYTQTFSELGMDIKNKIGHRGRVLVQLIQDCFVTNLDSKV